MLSKTLVKVGNSYALVLDRTLMDLVGISPDRPVTLQVQGSTLLVSAEGPPPSLEKAMDRVFETHGEALRRLAQ